MDDHQRHKDALEGLSHRLDLPISKIIDALDNDDPFTLADGLTIRQAYRAKTGFDYLVPNEPGLMNWGGEPNSVLHKGGSEQRTAVEQLRHDEALRRVALMNGTYGKFGRSAYPEGTGRNLFVRLESSENTALNYPCFGLLELFELGVDGSVICGVFRCYVDGHQIGGPVVVKRPRFMYDPSITAWHAHKPATPVADTIERFNDGRTA